MQERSIFKGQGYNKVNRCAVINILRKNKALFFFHNLSLQRRQTHPLPTHSVDITRIISHAFLSKNFVKVTVLLKIRYICTKELVDLTKYFLVREFLVFSHCAYLIRLLFVNHFCFWKNIL